MTKKLTIEHTPEPEKEVKIGKMTVEEAGRLGAIASWKAKVKTMSKKERSELMRKIAKSRYEK